MAEQKTEFDAECFGTVDKEKKEHCNHCNYSEQCTEFKPKLVELKEAAVQGHVDGRTREKKIVADKKEVDQNHKLVSLIIFVVFGIVFWLVLRSSNIL